MARAFKTGITADGDIATSGVLKSTASSGAEGGQVDLTKAASGTTLTTGVSIDVNGDKLRFFETGGNNRGYYLDMAAGGNSAGNLIQARAWVFSNANATSATTNTSQSIFQTGARSFSLDAGSTYYFRLNLGVNFTYSAVPAAIQLVPTFSQVPVAVNYSAAFISGTSGGVQSFRTTSTSAVSISPSLSATTTGSTILIEGFFQSNATTGGTVEFKYQISSGGGSSATATTGSMLQIQKIGTGAPGIVSGAWA